MLANVRWWTTRKPTHPFLGFSVTCLINPLISLSGSFLLPILLIWSSPLFLSELSSILLISTVFLPQVLIKTWWRWVKPIIFRPCEQPCLKSIRFLAKNSEWIGCGRRSGLLNIKQQVSGEGGKAVVMQCLTQLASPVHLPGSSRGSTLTFTQHDKPLLGQSHSSPLCCTLIMTWCTYACHTLEGGHLQLSDLSITYQLQNDLTLQEGRLSTSQDKAPLRLANPL